MTAPRTASCPTCNVALSESDRFCKHCGTEVSGENASFIGGAEPARTTPDLSALSAASPWELVLSRLRDVTAGEFDIGRELGRGGMAAVFLAQDMALNRKVAIKVMAPGLMMGDGMVQRFRQEAITIANLSHAHIVTIHAVRQLADLHFFVMQFVEGQSLDTVLRTHGTLSVPVVKAILHHVGSALAYAHRRGVVHRDIKPGNILLSGDGDALVTDFGIAKVAEGPSQTQTGMVVGTPTYMSPEQCYATDLDGASDQYSLGVVAYQMLTGETPFTGSAFAIMKGHTTESVKPIRERVPDIPAQLDEAILRMLAKKPSERFGTFSEALAAMGAAPMAPESPLRDELIRLAAVEERREQLGELLRTPSSPVPRSRSSRRLDAQARDETPRTPVPPQPAPPTIAIAIAPLPAELEVGDVATLRASVRGADGADALVWNSETPDVVTVNAQTGEVVACSVGDAIVIARIGDVTERLTCSVVAPRVAALQISGPGGDVHVGDSYTLAAAAVDKRGETLARRVEWSAVGSAAELLSSGELRLVATGRVAVTAACEGVYETIVLHVAPAPVASVTILSPTEPLEISRAVTLSVQLRDARGTSLLNRAVQWRVSDPTRARVDAAGVLLPLRDGAVEVVAECDGVHATLSLVVPPARAATLIIGQVPELVRDGDRFTLTAEARDAHGATVAVAPTWRSSNREVATVSSDGAVHALTAGRTEIHVSADDASASVSLTVHATPAAFAAAQSSARAATDAPNATAVLSGLSAARASSDAEPGTVAGAPHVAKVVSSASDRSEAASSRPRWMYAALAVPVLGLAVWLATRGGDAGTADGAAVASSLSSEAVSPTPGRGGPADAGAGPAGTSASDTEAADVTEVTADVAASSGTEPPPVQRPEAPTTALRRAADSLRTAPRGASSASAESRPRRVAEEPPTVRGGDSGAAAGDPTGSTSVAPPPAAPPPASRPTREPEPVAVSAAQLEQEARAVVNRFARAYESGSVSAVRAVYASIPPGLASDLEGFFEYAQRIKVTVRSVQPVGVLSATDGSSSRVEARVTIGFSDGRRDQSNPDTWRITLRRDGDGWQFAGLEAQ